MKKFPVIVMFLLLFCFIGAAYPETKEAALSATIEAVVSTAEAEKPVVVMEPTPEVKPAPKVTSVKFRDVPDEHWAASSVYELVNMGVTQGYPDGTFRGSNNITRYETAMFLSKMAGAMGGRGEETDMQIEKLRDDLRAEIRAIRAEIAELKRIPEEGEEKPITGAYTARIMFGNVFTTKTSVEGQNAPIGPLVRYRLKTTFAKTIGEGAKVKINIDTMDSGFGGGSSDLSTKMLDIEGNMRLNLGFESPVDVKVTSGPGPVVHTEEADANGNFIARSENNVVYLRPWNSVMFSTKFMGMDTGLGYTARKLSAFGEVEVNQFTLLLGYNFPGMFIFPSIKFSTTIDQLSATPQSSPPGPTDTKYTLEFSSALSQKHRLNLLYSAGKGSAPSNSMVGIGVDLLDMWDTGTTILIKYKKVGAEYLQENATLNESLFAGLDVFNRYIGDGNGRGVVDVGLELTQIITEPLRLFSKVDWRLAGNNAYGTDYPESGITICGGVEWDIATDTMLKAWYQVETIPAVSDPSSDLTQICMQFKF